jgi:hypothetical protein
MSAKIATLQHPIDVMFLIHKALRAEAARAEKLAEDLGEGASLQPFKLAFNAWATALVYHAEAEVGIDMAGEGTSRRQDSNPVPEWRLISAVIAQEDEEHRDLIKKLQGVLTVLDEDIGKSSVITRTKQHLYGQVLALRVSQEDHLETEEALVLPIVRERLSERRQLEVVKGLLIDERAQDPRWIIQWVSQELEPRDQKLLAGLEARFNGLAP